MISLGAGRPPVSQLHEKLNLLSAFETCHWGSKTAAPGDHHLIMYTFSVCQSCGREKPTAGRLDLQRCAQYTRYRINLYFLF